MRRNVAGILLILFCAMLGEVAARAQQGPTGSAGTPGAALSQVGPQNSTLSAAELRGKKVFLQRCSICHLPPLYEPPEVKPYGPLLGGYVRNPQMEARARQAIRVGTPRMPGFQYTLEPSEIDDVIAYMKTMQAAPAAAVPPKSEGGSNAGTGRTGD